MHHYQSKILYEIVFTLTFLFAVKKAIVCRDKKQTFKEFLLEQKI